MSRPRTMGKVIHLGVDLDIPAEEFIESATAFLGKRKSGKSGAVKVLAEEASRLELPFILLDPVGVHYGIRSSYDGKKPSGLPVLVIGGKFGDLELDRKKGTEIARAIVESNVSVVIDFSDQPKAAYREFVADLADELFRLNDSPRLLILEEAAQLVPQTIRPDMARTYDAVERLVSLGRNKAIGVVLVGQRASKVNKDVLTQVDNLFVGRMLHPIDQKAMGDWVEAWDVEDRFDEFKKGLASLPTQTLWLWSPETLKEFRPVKIRNFNTLHGDLTHLRRLHLLGSKPVGTDISGTVAKLVPILKEAAEAKASGGEVGILHRKVLDLQRQLSAKSIPATPVRVVEKVVVDHQAIDAAVIKTERRYAKLISALSVSLMDIERDASAAYKAVENFGMEPVPSVPTPLSVSKPDNVRSIPSPEPVDPGMESVSLCSGEKKMLTELARRSNEFMNRSMLSIHSGYSITSSTFATYTNRLRRLGYIVIQGQEYKVTEAGIVAIGPVSSSPPDHEGLMSEWRSKLSRGEIKMLDALASRYPGSLTPEELSNESGYSLTSSTFATYTNHMRRLHIISKNPDRTFVASESLFP